MEQIIQMYERYTRSIVKCYLYAQSTTDFPNEFKRIKMKMKIKRGNGKRETNVHIPMDKPKT